MDYPTNLLCGSSRSPSNSRFGPHLAILWGLCLGIVGVVGCSDDDPPAEPLPPEIVVAACFELSGTSGTTQDDFSVDATCSTDSRTPPGPLEYRWDWEGSGEWDTEWSGNPLATHAYSTAGEFELVLDVREESGVQSQARRTITVTDPPVITVAACFELSDTSGTTQDDFSVDATCSTDSRTPPGPLEYRWDWEGDGEWDAEWSSDPLATHAYSTAGEFEIVLEVREESGVQNQARRTITVADPPLPPFAHYLLDGTGEDSSGNGFHGSVQGAEPATDRFGNPEGALFFRSRGDRVLVSPVPMVAREGLTIAAWVNMTRFFGNGTHNGNPILFYRVGTNSPYDEYYLTAHSGGALRFVLQGGGVGSGIVVEGAVSADTWHHVVGTWGEEELRIYVDGQLKESGVSPVVTLQSLPGQWFQIGATNGGNPPFWQFEGSMDDLRVFDRALTAAEILYMYKELSLVGRLGEGPDR